MTAPWWLDDIRKAEANRYTVATYLLSTTLFLVALWAYTRVKHRGNRTWVHAALVAIAFAPGILQDPGGLIMVLPAWVAAIGNAVLWSMAGEPFGFYMNHPFVSIALVWGLGVLVGTARTKPPAATDRSAGSNGTDGRGE